MTAAREEFARRGFEGARVDQIARRAGVNKQLLFYYFHSKRGLFGAVLARGATELEQALAAIPTSQERPLERIRTTLEAQFQYLAAHPDLVVLLTQAGRSRSEEHTSELQSQSNLVCRLLLEKKKKKRD